MNVNIENSPFRWEKINIKGNQKPEARVYHSCCIWQTTNKSQMILIFGGRNSSGKAMNDLWGLRRHNNGVWDWLAAPYKKDTNSNIPINRYQHTGLCFQNLFLLVGGRSGGSKDVEGNELTIDLFDLDNSDWHNLSGIRRFRHVTWVYNSCLYIYGGEPSMPDDMLLVKIDLLKELERLPGLDLKKIMGTSSNTNNPGNNRYETPNIGGYALSNSCIVAEPYQGQATIRKVKIADLEREGIKIDKQVNIEDKNEFKDFLNDLVARLTQTQEWSPPKENQFFLDSQTCHVICDHVIEILSQEPQALLRLRPPVKIFGSIHGQFGDLLRIFEEFGNPVEDMEGLDYLFLGNYVDRGLYSLEVIFLLFTLKILYPRQIHLLRGSHEDPQVNIKDGLGEECRLRLNERIDSKHSVFARINKVFEYLPLAAVVASKIFCVHSGIGDDKSLSKVTQIDNIKLPYQFNYSDNMVTDLMWSDPVLNEMETENTSNEIRQEISKRIVRFGLDRIENFLQKNGLEVIVRSHECVKDGIEKFGTANLYTIFSCTDYGGEHRNKAAILIVNKNWTQIDAKWIECQPGNTFWRERKKITEAPKAGTSRPLTPIRKPNQKRKRAKI